MITGGAVVAYHTYKPYCNSALIQEKSDFDSLWSQNHFFTKLGAVDYVRDPTTHDNFGRVALRVWSQHIYVTVTS